MDKVVMFEVSFEPFYFHTFRFAYLLSILIITKHRMKVEFDKT
jgi:hypothetical protein